MRNILIRFGAYENVTVSGQDGSVIQFSFVMMVSSMAGTPAEFQMTTSHRLRVGVAARISWGDDEVFLARVLFAVGKKEIENRLQLQGDLSELETVFIPHGECPVDPKTLIDPEGAIVEVEFIDRLS